MRRFLSSICRLTAALSTCVFVTACTKPHANAPGYRLPNCPRAPAITDERSIKASFETNSGMYGIWRPQAYANICSLSAWDGAFVKNESIEPYIRSGSFIPLYLHQNGDALIEVRIGSAAMPASPTSIEARWTTNASEPYLFESDGVLALSGIEVVNGSANPQVHALPLAAGRWTLTVRVLEPPYERSGKNDQIPNFLVLANPEIKPAPAYRLSVETFSQATQPP